MLVVFWLGREGREQAGDVSNACSNSARLRHRCKNWCAGGGAETRKAGCGSACLRGSPGAACWGRPGLPCAASAALSGQPQRPPRGFCCCRRARSAAPSWLGSARSSGGGSIRPITASTLVSSAAGRDGPRLAPRSLANLRPAECRAKPLPPPPREKRGGGQPGGAPTLGTESKQELPRDINAVEVAGRGFAYVGNNCLENCLHGC